MNTNEETNQPFFSIGTRVKFVVSGKLRRGTVVGRGTKYQHCARVKFDDLRDVRTISFSLLSHE